MLDPWSKLVRGKFGLSLALNLAATSTSSITRSVVDSRYICSRAVRCVMCGLVYGAPGSDVMGILPLGVLVGYARAAVLVPPVEHPA
jgi:hypothetical protein